MYVGSTDLASFETDFQPGSRACVVRLSGDIDLSVVPELRRDLEGALSCGCKDIVLDLSAVTYADSSAIGLLVWLDHHLAPRSGRLVLAGANRDVTRILEIAGLLAVASSITTTPNLDSALEGITLGEPPAPPIWQETLDVVAEAEGLSDAREAVCRLLEPLDLPESSMFDIKVALGEALANAVRHGAPASGEASVAVRVTAYDDRVVLEVIDNGPGFDGVAQRSDDLYRPSGRGIRFMEALMDRVEFAPAEGGGTVVKLVKHRARVR